LGKSKNDNAISKIPRAIKNADRIATMKTIDSPGIVKVIITTPFVYY
jgi:hypothetical protein